MLEAGSEQVLGEVKINKYFCKVIKTAHLGLQNHEPVVGIRKASLMVGGRKVPSQNGVEGRRAAQDEGFEEALFEQPPVLATIATGCHPSFCFRYVLTLRVNIAC